MDIARLRSSLEDGLLCFPVTDMNRDGHIDIEGYQARVEWLLSFEPSSIFVAGGTGEFFSLARAEYEELIKAAVDVVQGRVPIIASAGRSIVDAVEHARVAAQAGADALLLMPPYLTSCPNDGTVMYAEQILRQTDLPAIYYNRANGVLGPEELQLLADKCPNLIGLKDGTSNMQDLNCIIRTMGDRLSYIGGAPTAEIISEAYLSIGVNTYSSAVFNFVPRLAKIFYKSLRSGNHENVQKLLRTFFIPFVQLRDSKKGYAVSLIKAGAALAGKDPGQVRPPLVMPSDLEVEQLRKIMHASESIAASMQ